MSEPKNSTTDSMPLASLLAYLFPDRFIGARKSQRNSSCVFEFEPESSKDEYRYEQIREMLYDEEGIPIANALGMIIACGAVKKAIMESHRSSD